MAGRRRERGPGAGHGSASLVLLKIHYVHHFYFRNLGSRVGGTISKSALRRRFSEVKGGIATDAKWLFS